MATMSDDVDRLKELESWRQSIDDELPTGTRTELKLLASAGGECGVTQRSLWQPSAGVSALSPMSSVRIHSSRLTSESAYRHIALRMNTKEPFPSQQTFG
jgi:hypothetical protein